jgi:hypothetical protein
MALCLVDARALVVGGRRLRMYFAVRSHLSAWAAERERLLGQLLSALAKFLPASDWAGWVDTDEEGAT